MRRALAFDHASAEVENGAASGRIAKSNMVTDIDAEIDRPLSHLCRCSRLDVVLQRDLHCELHKHPQHAPSVRG